MTFRDALDTGRLVVTTELVPPRGADADGNTVVGKHLGIDSKRTIVHAADGHLVVTMGLEDMLVVHTPDATLVARREHEEAVRRVVAELEKRGWTEFL